MKEIAADKLAQADLIVDAIYQGGRKRNAGDDPLPHAGRQSGRVPLKSYDIVPVRLTVA